MIRVLLGFFAAAYGWNFLQTRSPVALVFALAAAGCLWVLLGLRANRASAQADAALAIILAERPKP